MTKHQFLLRMKEACEVARQKGARFNEAVVTAQAALESAWGNSQLARMANNLFGIKAGPSWYGAVLELPTREWDKKRGWYAITAKWRKYPSWSECIVDYANLIARLSWFKDALNHLENADSFLKALLPSPPRKPGWATDPNYFDKVKKAGMIIEGMGGVKWV